MVVLSSRLRAGSSEWEKPRMFYQIADRNLTGTALLNDHQGTLYHINGVEAAGHWQNLMMTLRTSTDNGQTWSKPRIIAPEHTRRHQVIAGTSITKEGWFVQACDAGPGGRDGAAVHISKDKGKLGRIHGMEHLCLILKKGGQVPLSLESMPEWCN